jgi:hypothetical protein
LTAESVSVPWSRDVSDGASVSTHVLERRRIRTCHNNAMDMDTVTARRNRMQVRAYSSLAAHDQDDARFWAALPVEERVLQVWKLSEAQWRLRGEFPDESGLPRSTARVHRP